MLHSSVKKQKSRSEKFHFGDLLMCKSNLNLQPDLCKSKPYSLPDLCQFKLNSLLDLSKSKLNSLPDLCKCKLNVTGCSCLGVLGPGDA